MKREEERGGPSVMEGSRASWCAGGGEMRARKMRKLERTKRGEGTEGRAGVRVGERGVKSTREN